MVSVAFEVKLTLGSSAVIGESNAVVLGLLCGEKGGKAGSVSLQSFFPLFRRSKMLCILLRRGIAVY